MVSRDSIGPYNTYLMDVFMQVSDNVSVFIEKAIKDALDHKVLIDSGELITESHSMYSKKGRSIDKVCCFLTMYRVDVL